MWSFGPIGNNLTTHNKGTSSPHGQQGRTCHPKCKGTNLDLTPTTKIKSGDHREIKHGIGLKPHQAHGLYVL